MKQTRKLIRSKGRNIHKKNKSRKYSRKLRTKSYKGGLISGMQYGGAAPAPAPSPAPATPAVTTTMGAASVFSSLGTFYTAVYTIRDALTSGSAAAAAHVTTEATDVTA